MSVQPFSNLGMADDFFSVVLQTDSKTTGTNAEPMWVINPSSAMQDRYKFYKRCFAVVDFLAVRAHQNFTTGEAICVRDVNSSQPNSFDSKNGFNNIIYITRGIDANDGTIASTNPTPVSQETAAGVFTGITHRMSFTGATKLIPSTNGFPFEKVNPFGEQRYVITSLEQNLPIDCGSWGIKVTYYFYKE